MRVSEGIFDFFKGKEKTLADDPEYKGWLKVYLKNPDIAELHKRHKEFLQYFQQSNTNENMVTDFIKNIWSNDIPAEQYNKYLEYAKGIMNFTMDKDLRIKLIKKFPELKDNNTDLNRVLNDIAKLRQKRQGQA
jgi:hypothetical protein